MVDNAVSHRISQAVDLRVCPFSVLRDSRRDGKEKFLCVFGLLARKDEKNPGETRGDIRREDDAEDQTICGA